MINSREDLKRYLAEDERALFLSDSVSWFAKVKNPIWKYQRCLRYCEYFKNTTKVPMVWNPVYLFYKLRLHRMGIKLGFSIPENVFGPGLSIAHYGSIIVNPHARVGHHCRIHVGVNIGANKSATDAPVIGNHVYIGPGAKVFGNIHIGDNTKIGANAVVNKNCKGNCTLVGIPARAVKENGTKE